MNRPTGNVILFIAVCTVFFRTAHGETCYYTSTCYQQERYTETCGWWWGENTCSRYRTVSVSCDKSATCNYTLSSCGSCSVTCGGGVQSCTYQCSAAYCTLSDRVQIQSCNTQTCPPVHGNWSAWSSWISNGPCSVTCGGGIQTQTRDRSCNNPFPQNVGEQCNGSSTEFQTIQCNTQPCPIDGNWNCWSDWILNGTCSVTCGGGIQIQTRIRSCTNPIPQNGGRQCNGSSSESQTIQCNTQTCPIDGGWSAWNGWTSNRSCSVTCGEGIGTETRNRSCTNPIPQNGGKQCTGTSVESQTIQCNTQSCPIDGDWSAWNGWTSSGTCSVTCGEGIESQTRNRSCTNPLPQNGVRQCNGTSTETQTIMCKTRPCAIVDGHWTEWSEWTSDETCSVTCGGGIQTQTRNRSCTNPAPTDGGRDCNGRSTESKTIECSKQTCPTECNNGNKKENSEDCGKFFICASDTWKEMRCNSGTVFNPMSKSCDWPENVPKCNNVSNSAATTSEASVTQGSKCNSVNCACDEIVRGYTKHPTDCTKFIHCVWNNAIISSCANGTYWDQSQLTCGHGTC